jgi:hypothetical protein
MTRSNSSMDWYACPNFSKRDGESDVTRGFSIINYRVPHACSSCVRQAVEYVLMNLQGTLYDIKTKITFIINPDNTFEQNLYRRLRS